MNKKIALTIIGFIVLITIIGLVRDYFSEVTNVFTQPIVNN